MSNDQITIRRAEPEDQASITALLDQAHGAYNPYVADVGSWIAAPEGLPAVAVCGDRVVAFGRLYAFAHDEWWIEGLVTHPEFRRRGLMQRIFLFGGMWWLKHGAGDVRGMISRSNKAVSGLIDNWDVARAITYSHFMAEPESGPHEFEPLTEDDLDWVLAQAETSCMLNASDRSFERRWRWRTWRPAAVRELLAAGEGFRWRGGEGMAFLWSRVGVTGPEMRVWLAVAPGKLAQLARSIRAYGAAVFPALDPRAGIVHWRIPESEVLREGVTSAGFVLRDTFENTFYIVNMKHDRVLDIMKRGSK